MIKSLTYFALSLTFFSLSVCLLERRHHNGNLATLVEKLFVSSRTKEKLRNVGASNVQYVLYLHLADRGTILQNY